MSAPSPPGGGRPRSFHPLVLALSLASIVGGCASASTPGTPQQDYVREMGRVCDARHRDWSLDQVEPDGRYTVRGAPDTEPSPRLPYFDCMREQFAAKPYGQWLRRRSTVGGVAPSPRIAADPFTRPVPGPTWSIGDEWSYRWESPSGKGTFTWTVARFETIEGVEATVIRAGNREIFYRRADRAHILDKVDGEIVVRNKPPVAVVAFPLRSGSEWTLDYTRQRPAARQSEEMLMDCRADPAERVTVPAGTFAASHVSCVHRRTGSLSFEAWYAPEVGQSVKELAVFSYGIRVRELVSFKTAAH